jgi:hypothetical protein
MDSTISNYKPIRILEESSINGSILYGSLDLLGGSKIEKSFLRKLGGESTIINASEISSSNIKGYGKVLNSKINNGSTIGSLIIGVGGEELPFEITSASLIDNSTVSGSKVYSSTIDKKSSMTQSTLMNNSFVSASSVSGSTIDASKITDSSFVLSSQVVAKSEINQSSIQNSVIDNSKVITESTVYDSTIKEGSTITTSMIYGNSTIARSNLSRISASLSNIANSILSGPFGFTQKTINSSKCYLNLGTADETDYICEPLSLP